MMFVLSEKVFLAQTRCRSVWVHSFEVVLFDPHSIVLDCDHDVKSQLRALKFFKIFPCLYIIFLSRHFNLRNRSMLRTGDILKYHKSRI